MKKISFCFLIFLIFCLQSMNSNSITLVPSNKIVDNVRIIDVDILNKTYSQTSIRIAINEQVMFNFTNLDEAVHTFTLDNLSFGIDLTISNGASVQLNFTAPADPQILSFYCKNHVNMEGNLIIFDPASSSASGNPSDSFSLSTPFGTDAFVFALIFLSGFSLVLKRRYK